MLNAVVPEHSVQVLRALVKSECVLVATFEVDFETRVPYSRRVVRYDGGRIVGTPVGLVKRLAEQCCKTLWLSELVANLSLDR